MPPSAIRTTETLFRRLVGRFAPPHNVHLRLFAPPNLFDRPNDLFGAAPYYENIDKLLNADIDDEPIDALIVTGTEARASSMEEEPSWPYLQKVCDWAAENTISTLWSCFSAHAAVRHIDGIRRHRMPKKLSGVFRCRKAAGHFMVDDLPEQFSIPHSRYRGLVESELEGRHFRILSHSPDVGVDSFTKRHGNSQFVFLQGHPEYASQTLLAEYCRDVKRFIAGERSYPPNLPENYFADDCIEAVAALGRRGNAFPDRLVLSELVKSTTGIREDWREPAQQLYGAWLRHVAEQKLRNGNHHLAHDNAPEAA